MRQKAAMSMSMIDENSNTMPYFQKRHSMNGYGNTNDQLYQHNKQCFTQRQPFDEISSSTLQPQQIYYSNKQISIEETTQNPAQLAKYSSQNYRNNQQQGNHLNHYSNDLSPIDMTQQQLSTQSSSPDFDLAIVIKNSSSSSSSNVNASNKTGSFIGSGSMKNSQQMHNNQSGNTLNRNNSTQQQQMMASKGYKNSSHCGSSFQEYSSLSTRATSMNTNESTGLNKNISQNYNFQDDFDETTQTRDHHFIEQMECQDVEDFSLYIDQYVKNKSQQSSSCMEIQKPAVSQEEMYQEELFGNNPLYVPKYGYSIVQNLFKTQKNYKIAVITDPRDLILRENLIDLMSRMSSQLKLQDETFYLAVNIFARYLDIERKSLSGNKLIILIATCLFVAAKYQEIYPPPLRDFIGVLSSHKIYLSVQDILDQEGDILIQLNFSLFGPTRLQFFEAYLSQANNLDPVQLSFCYYLIELTTLNHSFYRYDHSEIAASAILLSEKFKNISGKYFWSEKLEIITNYKQSDIYDCVEDMYQYLVNVGHNRKSLFIYYKYSDAKHKSVSKIDYDLTHNVNQKSNKQNGTDSSATLMGQEEQNDENNYCPSSSQSQQSQQNQMNKSFNNYQNNNINMTQSQSSYPTYSQNCDEQFYSSQGPCSKAKSECYNTEYNENQMNFASDARKFKPKYDITKYLKTSNQ